MSFALLIVYYWNDTEFLTLQYSGTEAQMQQSDIRVKIMDINDGYERWKKIRFDLRRKEGY